MSASVGAGALAAVGVEVGAGAVGKMSPSRVWEGYSRFEDRGLGGRCACYGQSAVACWGCMANDICR